MEKRLKSRLDTVLLRFIPLTVIMGFIIVPFLWTISLSLKNEGDILDKPMRYLPRPATFENFITSWNNMHFSRYFFNSVFVSTFTVLSVITCSLLVGYGLTRFRFRGKRVFMFILLASQFVPVSMMLVPLFVIFKGMGLIGKLTALVIVNTTIQLPFNSIVMKGFFANIPIAVEEAAMIDGCGRVRTIFQILLPLLFPGMIAAGSIAFIGSWNEFLFALMFISSGNKFTLPVGLSYMLGQFDVNYGALAAGSMIALFPALLLFAYAQKYLVSGLSSGSVKG